MTNVVGVVSSMLKELFPEVKDGDVDALTQNFLVFIDADADTPVLDAMIKTQGRTGLNFVIDGERHINYSNSRVVVIEGANVRILVPKTPQFIELMAASTPRNRTPRPLLLDDFAIASDANVIMVDDVHMHTNVIDVDLSELMPSDLIERATTENIHSIIASLFSHETMLSSVNVIPFSSMINEINSDAKDNSYYDDLLEGHINHIPFTLTTVSELKSDSLVAYTQQWAQMNNNDKTSTFADKERFAYWHTSPFLDKAYSGAIKVYPSVSKDVYVHGNSRMVRTQCKVGLVYRGDKIYTDGFLTTTTGPHTVFDVSTYMNGLKAIKPGDQVYLVDNLTATKTLTGVVSAADDDAVTITLAVPFTPLFGTATSQIVVPLARYTGFYVFSSPEVIFCKYELFMKPYVIKICPEHAEFSMDLVFPSPGELCVFSSSNENAPNINTFCNQIDSRFKFTYDTQTAPFVLALRRKYEPPAISASRYEQPDMQLQQLHDAYVVGTDRWGHHSKRPAMGVDGYNKPDPDPVPVFVPDEVQFGLYVSAGDPHIHDKASESTVAVNYGEGVAVLVDGVYNDMLRFRDGKVYTEQGYKQMMLNMAMEHINRINVEHTYARFEFSFTSPVGETNHTPQMYHSKEYRREKKYNGDVDATMSEEFIVDDVLSFNEVVNEEAHEDTMVEDFVRECFGANNPDIERIMQTVDVMLSFFMERSLKSKMFKLLNNRRPPNNLKRPDYFRLSAELYNLMALNYNNNDGQISDVLKSTTSTFLPACVKSLVKMREFHVQSVEPMTTERQLRYINDVYMRVFGKQKEDLKLMNRFVETMMKFEKMIHGLVTKEYAAVKSVVSFDETKYSIGMWINYRPFNYMVKTTSPITNYMSYLQKKLAGRSLLRLNYAKAAYVFNMVVTGPVAMGMVYNDLVTDSDEGTAVYNKALVRGTQSMHTMDRNVLMQATLASGIPRSKIGNVVQTATTSIQKDIIADVASDEQLLQQFQQENNAVFAHRFKDIKELEYQGIEKLMPVSLLTAKTKELIINSSPTQVKQVLLSKVKKFLKSGISSLALVERMSLDVAVMVLTYLLLTSTNDTMNEVLDRAFSFNLINSDRLDQTFEKLREDFNTREYGRVADLNKADRQLYRELQEANMTDHHVFVPQDEEANEMIPVNRDDDENE